MTDKAQFDPAAIDEGVELVFDEIEEAPAPALAAPQKRVRIGRKVAAEAALAEEQREAADISPAEPAPSQPEPVAPPIAISVGLPTWMLAAALALALFTSAVACAGLLTASRTIADANAAYRAASTEKAAFAAAPATLDRLNHLIAAERTALASLAQGRAGQPVTLTDLQHELDGLRGAIAAHQPQQDMQIIAVAKSGQSELAERLTAIQDTLDHMTAKDQHAADRP